MERKVPTRWTRPAPARKLPPACAACRDGEEPEAVLEMCRGGCIPGGCSLAIGCDTGPEAWWRRRLTPTEEEALRACREGLRTSAQEAVVAGLADECWRAGCPLEEPDAARRRAASGSFPGCHGFCGALPPAQARPTWRLDGWLRELTPDEVAAVTRMALGFRFPADLAAVEALADECCAAWPCAELPWLPAPATDAGCPGFCQLASGGRWS